MGYTNRTPVRRLPQFTASDKPTWLGDVNEAFATIERELNDANNRIDTLSGQLTTVNARLAALEAK